MANKYKRGFEKETPLESNCVYDNSRVGASFREENWPRMLCFKNKDVVVKLQIMEGKKSGLAILVGMKDKNYVMLPQLAEA